jgi:hypothetical protein
MPRSFTPQARAKRDKKFFEKLARKNNPVRFLAALPPDVKLEEIDWNPDHLERIASWLADAKVRWQQEDDARNKRRLKEVLAAVHRDREAGYLP